MVAVSTEHWYRTCGRGRGVPGVVVWEGGWEGLYRYPPTHVPGTRIEHIPEIRAYPRPNEGNIEVSDEVS